MPAPVPAATATAGSHPAYREANRPVLRAQRNPRYRRHPEWPEEWYARVPGTPLSWAPPDAVAAGVPIQALETPAFPSAAEAEAAAVARWRERWRGQVQADACTQVRREQVFTVDWRARQADGQVPDGVTIPYKHAPTAASPVMSPALPLADPLELLGQHWVSHDVPERGQARRITRATDPAAVELARRRAAASPAPAAVDSGGGPWFVVALDPDEWSLCRPGSPWRFWPAYPERSPRPHRGRPGRTGGAGGGIGRPGATGGAAGLGPSRHPGRRDPSGPRGHRGPVGGRGPLLQEARGRTVGADPGDTRGGRAPYHAATPAVRAPSSRPARLSRSRIPTRGARRWPTC